MTNNVFGAVMSSLDFGTIGSSLLTDVGTAAMAGIGIFAAIFGIRVVIKAFSSAAA